MCQVLGFHFLKDNYASNVSYETIIEKFSTINKNRRTISEGSVD